MQRVSRCPARVGQVLEEVLTPALLVSMPLLERNETMMREKMSGTNVALRPHAKAHKSSGLALWHLNRAHGSLSGFCAQSISEADVLLRHYQRGTANRGRDCAANCDVLLTNEIVSEVGARLVAELAAECPQARLGVLVDSAAGVQALAAAIACGKHARSVTPELAVLLEVECGQDRCGVDASQPGAVTQLARAIVAAPGLSFAGLHVYHGGIQHVRRPADRRRAVLDGPAAVARRARDELVANGIDVPLITGGGTGTFEFDIAAGIHTEVQPGSFLFSDGDYGKNEDVEFVQSLHIHTTIISACEASGKRVCDAGAKAVDLVSGMPTPVSLECAVTDAALHTAGVRYTSGGDEHGVLRGVPRGLLSIGTRVSLVPSHCDPTVNLHDHIVGVRDGVVDTIFPVDARGPH